VLGDDATQFASNDDDLLGGGDETHMSPGNAQFESQFPDISTANEVGLSRLLTYLQRLVLTQ
jgi:hypothetical protein